MTSEFVTPAGLVEALRVNRVTHVPYLPDSEHSATYELLLACPDIRLIRVAREGETIAIAAGLIVGGKRPLVMIQNTGLFESGDSLRGFGLMDRERDGSLPIVLMIGYRGWSPDGDSKDSAARFTEPILRAWGVPFRMIRSDRDLPALAECYAEAERTGRPTAALVVEDDRYRTGERRTWCAPS